MSARIERHGEGDVKICRKEEMLEREVVRLRVRMCACVIMCAHA